MPDDVKPRPDRIPDTYLVTTAHDGTAVTVRQWRPSDLASYHEAMHASYEHLTPWMPWAAAEPQDIEAHGEILTRFSSTWDFDDFPYGIFLDDVAVGGSGLHNRVGAHGWEIGYWVHPGFEGRGIISATVRALTDEAFVDPTIQCVEIRCDATNVRSANVPRRLGFALVAGESRTPVAPAETDITHVYRVDRPAWLAHP